MFNRSATRLVFRLTQPGGAVIWSRVDTRSGGVYELEIIDEAGLDLSVEFDADALLEALNRDGQVAIYGILFDVDRATIRPGSGEVLDTIASIMDAESGLRLEVQGHTDSTGTADRNLRVVAGTRRRRRSDPTTLRDRCRSTRGARVRSGPADRRQQYRRWPTAEPARGAGSPAVALAAAPDCPLPDGSPSRTPRTATNG